MPVEISSILLWNKQNFTVLLAIRKPQLTVHCMKYSVCGRGLINICTRRLTSSACLELLLRDLQVPGGVWCMWSYMWAQVPPAASPANTSALVLCFCSRSPSIDNFFDSQCNFDTSGGPWPEFSQWTHGLYHFRPHQTATNSCDLLHQLITRRAWNRCFPDILWHRGTKSGESCFYFRFWWECGVIVLPILFSPRLPLICLVLTTHLLSLTHLHSFVLTSPCSSLHLHRVMPTPYVPSLGHAGGVGRCWGTLMYLGCKRAQRKQTSSVVSSS